MMLPLFLNMITKITENAKCSKCGGKFSPQFIDITNIMDDNLKATCTCSVCGTVQMIGVGPNPSKDVGNALLKVIEQAIVKASTQNKLSSLKPEIAQGINDETLPVLNEDDIKNLSDSMNGISKVSDMFGSDTADS